MLSNRENGRNVAATTITTNKERREKRRNTLRKMREYRVIFEEHVEGEKPFSDFYTIHYELLRETQEKKNLKTGMEWLRQE